MRYTERRKRWELKEIKRKEKEAQNEKTTGKVKENQAK